MSSGVRPHFQLLELGNTRRLEKKQKSQADQKKRDHQKDNGLRKDKMKLVETRPGVNCAGVCSPQAKTV